LKKLSFIGALSMVVGNIIGVGIFTTTGYLATYLQKPFLIMLAWFVGALYALSGARVYSILSRAYPLSGGDYQYLKLELHPLAAYLFGWSALFVTYSGSIAALGIAAAYYLNALIRIPSFDLTFNLVNLGWFEFNYAHSKIIAIGFIITFSWINFRGIYLSGIYQIILTAGIFLLLIGFSMSGLISPGADYKLLFPMYETNTLFSGFLTALVAVIFSYSGWTTAIYVAEEIDQADRIVPKALQIGVLLVGGIYLLINLTYLVALPVNEMRDVINIASVVFERLWGTDGAMIISFIILIAVLSSLNSTILSGPRIYMAMGREGYLCGSTKALHPRFKSPFRAIYLQMIWSVILVVSGSFNQLLNYVIFVIVGFSLMAAWMAWRVIRRKGEVTYLNLSAIIFYLLFCLIVMLNILYEKPMASITGLLIVSLAVPLYYFEKKRIVNK
jgi:APA family basic amino acid/polyamine antiporter